MRSIDDRIIVFLSLLLIFTVLFTSCKKEEKIGESFLYEKVLFDFDTRWKGIDITDYPKDFDKSTIRLQKITRNEVFLMNPDSEFSFQIPLSAEDLSLSFDYGIETGKRTLSKGSVIFSVEINGNRKLQRSISLKSASNRKNPVLKSSRINLDNHPNDGLKFKFKTKTKGVSSDDIKSFWRDITISKNKRIKRTHYSQRKPNVILVLVDALRWDHLGYNGYDRDISPFIDKLAGESLVLDHAFSTSTWTWPSVASLMTSKTPFEHGVDNIDTGFLNYNHKTLPEHLQQNGFTTMAFSGNTLISEKYNYDQGFEMFHQFNSTTHAEIITEKFLNTVQKFRKYRFFAYIHLMEPHMPYKAPYEYISKFTDPAKGKKILARFRKVKGKINRKREKMTPEMKNTLIDLYDSEIQYLDNSIKNMIDSLKKLDMMENTIIVFVADHGEEFMDHGFVTHGVNLYNTVLKIPFFLYYPSELNSDRLKSVTSIMDIYPTICSLAGVSKVSACRGKDITTGISGERNLVFSTQTGSGPTGTNIEHLGIMDYPFKLIRIPEENRTELYNLKKDTREMKDVSDINQSKSDLMKKKLLEALEKLGTETDKRKMMDKETKKRLKALGYIN